MAGAAYFADAYDDAPVPACPRPVRVLRALLWTNAAITAVMVVAGVVAAGVSVGVVAHLGVLAAPGAVAGTVAWRITRGSAGMGRTWYVWLLVAMGWQVVRAVSVLPGGDPRGFTSMLLPLASLVLAASRPVRAYLRSPHPRPYGGRGDSGAGMVEYAGLIVLAALILGSLVALGLPSQIQSGASSALCRVFGRDDCGTQSRRDRNGADPNAAPNRGNPNAGKPTAESPKKRSTFLGIRLPGKCDGFFACAWKLVTTDPANIAAQYSCTSFLNCTILGVGAVASAPWNTAEAITDDVKGIGDLVKDPASVKDGLRYVADHPSALVQLVWDDQSTIEWNHGDYLGAWGRLSWNVGSWFIPGVNVAKVFSKAGKFAKLGKLGKVGKLGKLGKLADDSGKAARRAGQLADKGYAAGAKKAADEARRAADDAKKEAKKSGCKIVGLGGVALRPALSVPHFGRYAAAVPMALPAQPTCTRAQIAEDAANAAKEAADRATREKNLNRALARGRYEDADNLIDQARNAAKDAAERAKDRPTAANKEAARKAQRAAEVANKRVINQKINKSLRSADAGERAEGDVGQALRDHLVNFQKMYGRNGTLGETDAETNKAIIEVKNGSGGRAPRRIANDLRTKKLPNQTINPNGKPWIVYTPQLDAAQAARVARSTGVKVVRTIPELKRELRALGEPVN